MSDNTTIEWTDSTFNQWTGCTKVSPACDHCYAEGVEQAREREIVATTVVTRLHTAPENVDG